MMRLLDYLDSALDNVTGRYEHGGKGNVESSDVRTQQEGDVREYNDRGEIEELQSSAPSLLASATEKNDALNIEGVGAQSEICATPASSESVTKEMEKENPPQIMSKVIKILQETSPSATKKAAFPTFDSVKGDMARVKAEAWLKVKTEMSSKGPVGFVDNITNFASNIVLSPEKKRPGAETLGQKGPHKLKKLTSFDEKIKLEKWDSTACYACGGLWDNGGAVVSQMHQCDTCKVISHGVCRDFLQNCSECDPNRIDLGPPKFVNCAGVVKVQLMQAFKLALAPGDSVYAVLQLLPWKERHKTSPAIWEDMGASWGTTVKSQNSSKNSIYIELEHLHNSETPPIPVLKVELWRSDMKIMDELIGLAEISAAPLMRKTGAKAERWHKLLPPQEGIVLLSLQFEPHSTPPGKNTPTKISLDESNSGDGRLSDSVKKPQAEIVNNNEEHMFRLRTYKKLTWCAICNGTLLGIYNQGFRCEVCRMDVHERCQVKAHHSTSCSLTRDDTQDNTDTNTGNDAVLQPSGVGIININLRSAHRCGVGCSSDGSVHDLGPDDPVLVRKSVNCYEIADKTRATLVSHGSAMSKITFFGGNHYCRARIGEKGGPGGGQQKCRTRTVFQTANPLFNTSWALNVPTYSSLLEIELRDGTSDKTIGVLETSAFALMQRDADASANSSNNFMSRHVNWYELRDPRTEKIVGLIKAQISFTEDKLGLFIGPDLRSVPPRVLDDLNVETLKRYVERAQAIIGWFSVWNAVYHRVMSWENRPLTAGIFVLFMYVTLFASSEYVFSILPFLVLVYIGHTWRLRRDGTFLRTWVEGETVEQKASDVLGYRPLSQLKISVLRGHNLVSNDLNLPGNAYVRVSYVVDSTTGTASDPLKLKTLMSSFRGANELIIGETAPSEDQSPCPDPEWKVAAPWGGGRGGSLGENLLLQNVTECWKRKDGESSVEDIAMLYPILEPRTLDGKPLPWSDIPGFIRFSVIFANPFNSLMDSEQGSVFVPIRALSGGTELCGWLPVDSSDYLVSETVHLDSKNLSFGAIFVRMQLCIKTRGDRVNAEDIEASRAVEASMENLLSPIWSQLGAGMQSFLDGNSDHGSTSIGSNSVPSTPQSGSNNPLAAVRNLRTGARDVQMTISSVIDTIESAKNLLNWTHPQKTGIVACLLFFAWLLLLFVPGRYLVLIGGIFGFSEHWIKYWIHGAKKDWASHKYHSKPNAWEIGMKNFLAGVPTDADLRRCYRWDAYDHAAKIAEKNRLNTQRAKLQAIGLGCQWEGNVIWQNNGSWMERYLIVQGRRVAWWISAKQLQAGKPPEYLLLLQGHAGLTSPSPLEIKEAQDPNALLCIFGRDEKGRPLRCLLRTKDKIGLENAILNSIDTSKTD